MNIVYRYVTLSMVIVSVGVCAGSITTNTG